jgi:hypothetical protein
MDQSQLNPFLKNKPIHIGINNITMQTFKIYPLGQDKTILKHVLKKIWHGQQMIHVEEETGQGKSTYDFKV